MTNTCARHSLSTHPSFLPSFYCEAVVVVAMRTTDDGMKAADDTDKQVPHYFWLNFFFFFVHLHWRENQIKSKKGRKKGRNIGRRRRRYFILFFFSFKGVGANNWTGWRIVGRSRACRRRRCCRTTFRPPWIRDWSPPKRIYLQNKKMKQMFKSLN